MGQRRRAREYALQMLFQIDLTGVAPEQVFRTFWSTQNVEESVRSFGEQLVLGVYAERGETDRLITGAADRWKLNRMPVVDRNVLRMAIYELLHHADTPPAVVIDEAIEVAKKFGSAESGGFINGILDAVRRRVERGRAENRRDMT